MKLLGNLLLLHLTASSSQSSPPYLFIVHDAGESYMALPALQQLAEQGYGVDVLALGEPATSIYAPYRISASSSSSSSPSTTSSSSDDSLLRSYVLSDLGVDVEIVDGNVSRAQLLTPTQSAAVVGFFSPRAVVGVGMVYAMQSQLARAFRHGRGSENRNNNNNNPAGAEESPPPPVVVGLDDSFALWDPTSLPARLFVAPPLQGKGPDVVVSARGPAVVDEVFVTAASIATAVANISGGLVGAAVTGSPTLDEWAADAADAAQARATRTFVLDEWARQRGGGQRQLLQEEQQQQEQLVMIYAGSYGGDDYTASLQTFCSTATMLAGGDGSSAGSASGSASASASASTSASTSASAPASASTSSPFVFVFSPHPGYNPSFEAGLFAQWGCGRDVLVANSSWGLDTGQLVVASNGSLSEASTVGGQSLSVTKPHAYTSAAYADVFTEAGLIPASGDDAAALAAVLNGTFRDEAFTVPPDTMYKAGVPPNGTAIVAARLLSLLDEQQQEWTMVGRTGTMTDERDAGLSGKDGGNGRSESEDEDDDDDDDDDDDEEEDDDDNDDGD